MDRDTALVETVSRNGIATSNGISAIRGFITRHTLGRPPLARSQQTLLPIEKPELGSGIRHAERTAP